MSMARGIFIRESDLGPLISLILRTQVLELPVMEREARATVLEDLMQQRDDTPPDDIRRDQRLRHEFNDDTWAFHMAESERDRA